MKKKYLNCKYDFGDSDLVSIYDDLPLWSASFGLKLLERVRIGTNLNVLDIGCGTGFPLLELAERLGETCKVFGVDPWEEAVRRIELKIKKRDIKNVNVSCCCAESLDFDDNYFDIIVSNNGINNVQDQYKVLSECFRVCAEKGQFIFTYNLPETMSEFYDVFLKILTQNNRENDEERMMEHIYSKRKPVQYYKALLKDIGFNIKNIIEDKFVYRFANGTAMLNYFFIRLCFIDSWKDIVKVSETEDVFEELENQLNQIAADNGELVITVPYACIECNK